MPVPHRAPDSLVGFHTGGRAGPLRRPGGLAPDADEGLPGGLRRLFLGVVSRFPRTRPLFLRARLELLALARRIWRDLPTSLTVEPTFDLDRFFSGVGWCG